MKNKRILIAGNSYALTKKLSQEAEKVYAAPGSSMMSEFAECIDIREYSASELLKFVIKNNIDLTIAVSEKAISSDIAAIFQANGKCIFAPTAQSADFAISKAQGKRFLYKLHAPCPHFGIFEKQQPAADYLKNALYPLVIRSDKNEYECDRFVCTTFDAAKNFMQDLFSRGVNRIVIEDYVYGHEFTMYIVTDGYHAIPLTTVSNYKFSQDGDGGLLTSGVAAVVPDYKIPLEIQNKLFKNVVLNALNSLEKKGTPYLGILGVDAVLTSPDTYSVIEFKPFLQDFDAQAVLNLIDEDLIDLFEACANGFFADEYEDILTNDNMSVSCLVKSRQEGKIIPNIDLVESEISFLGAKRNEYFEYISVKGNNIALTSCAKTVFRAKKILEEDLSLIDFDGIKYRHDVYKT